MNTKQGLVTAAWVLGSSMMLDAGQTAEAQQATNPAEYFAPQAAPQRTPAKSAPGLLPSALRSLNQSSNGDVARPIPTSTTPDAASKINGNKPASMIRPSSRSVQATMYQQPGVSVQPANQNNGTPSPVQQQLEELYRRDGRQMPPMTLQQAPNTQGPVGANQIQRPQTGNVAQAGKNTPAGVIAPKASNKPSFLSKLNPFKSRQAPATLPQHPTQLIPEPNGFVGRQPNGLPFMPSKPVVIPNPFNKAQPMQVPPAPIARVAIAPAPPAQIESSTKDGATAIRSELSKSLPPVPGDPDYVATGSKNDATQTSAKPAGSVDEAIQNAFSDIAEEVVDGATPAPASEPKTAAEPNPFSGLSLDDDSSEAATPKATQPKTKLTLEANKAEDEISLEADKPLETDADLDSIPLPTEPEDVADLKADPKAEVATQDVDAKISLIKSRGELRGLKGFCAVALRDARDLKNALPEHTSTFKGRTYYFSSDEAKATFEKHPELYAPISGGNDIVLLKEKITKEGSLDHAVWFKDRLYLFTSQKTLEQFVATPKEFVISE